MKTISVVCYDNPQFAVEAHVFLEWAAHPGIDSDGELRDDWWTVTHVPSGRCLRRSVGEFSWTRETDAEAEALIRTGWSPD